MNVSVCAVTIKRTSGACPAAYPGIRSSSGHPGWAALPFLHPGQRRIGLVVWRAGGNNQAAKRRRSGCRKVAATPRQQIEQNVKGSTVGGPPGWVAPRCYPRLCRRHVLRAKNIDAAAKIETKKRDIEVLPASRVHAEGRRVDHCQVQLTQCTRHGDLSTWVTIACVRNYSSKRSSSSSHCQRHLDQRCHHHDS